jgi:hypothetical protein
MAQSITIDNKLYGGLQDYTRNLMDADQFYQHENNRPATFSFVLQDLGDPDFIVPSRGSYVTFEDNRFESRDEGVPDGILFTGYISDDPEPVFLGVHGSESVWEYRMVATSEDYLPQLKQLPSKIYVNKTRGFIIRDVVEQMFVNADVVPLDTSGVRDGGIERLYQTDTNKKFADMLADFAKADAFRYRVLNGKLFYEPEAEILPGSSDPQVKLVIDSEDPRYTPSNIQLERVATSITNDVTVLGEQEPTTLVQEHYVSDGYQGEHRLFYTPYGVQEKTLVDDDFTAPSFDTSIWQEEDDAQALTGVGDGSYLQMFEGAFNIVGGAGTAEAPEVWLRSRRGIEMSGIIEFRDCEIYFAAGSTGSGIVGGLFSDELMRLSDCVSGWNVDLDSSQLGVIIGGEAIESAVPVTLVLDDNHHYILRRRFEFDAPIGNPTSRRGPRETEVVFGEEPRAVNGWVTYTVEVQDITDPQNVVISKNEIYNARIESVPEFVLYAPIVSYNLHAVMNFCKVWKPQQVRLEVNGITVPLGDFIDGGVATILTDENGSFLKWYSIPASTPTPSDPIVPPSVTPFAHWKLGDGGTHLLDSGAQGIFPVTQEGSIALTPGAPANTSDQGRLFPGSGAKLFGPTDGATFFNGNTGCFPIPFSITGWVKTTASDGPIFEFPSLAFGYVGIYVSNGRISSRLSSPESQISGITVVNDGAWHHFAVVHNAVAFSVGTTSIYVDGVIDGSGDQVVTTPQAAFGWTIGYGNAYWNSLGTFVETWFSGSLDEIALWSVALTASSVDGLYRTATSQTGATPPPAYNPQTGVTIPPQGSKVDITYYRSEQAKARIKSTDSILTERAKFGDDGIRQHTIMPEDVFPVPRSSAECQFLGQAFLADRASHRYEGSYTFETGERDITRLDIAPAPGDLIPCFLSLPNGEKIDTNLHCTRVEVAFAGEGAYSFTLGVGPRNRFDEAQRKLLLARKSSLENPEIKDNETLNYEVLNSTGYSIPDSPKDLLVTNVTPLTFTVNMNPLREAAVGGYGAGGGTEVNGDLPDGVVGYEIRRDDTGWGQVNYVARVSSATFALNRGTRDRAYFVRPFNAQNNYSRQSALVRVISPLSNTLVASGLDGDISADTIRLFIPIDRNPDIGGWLVQKNNADGAVLYQGDGVNHRTIVSGAIVLVESGRVTLSLPISTGATTVRVLVYNILGEFGPETLFTITRAAPTV